MHLSLVLSKAITPTKSLVADITLQTKGTSMGLAMAVQILPTWEHWSTIFALEISRVIMHLLLMTISMSSMFKVSFAHLTCIAPWASHNKPVLDSCLFEKWVQKCTYPKPAQCVFSIISSWVNCAQLLSGEESTALVLINESIWICLNKMPYLPSSFSCPSVHHYCRSV